MEEGACMHAGVCVESGERMGMRLADPQLLNDRQWQAGHEVTDWAKDMIGAGQSGWSDSGLAGG